MVSTTTIKVANAKDKANGLKALTSFLGGLYNTVPEAKNDFAIGDINQALNTQLQNQALTSQMASQQAYNNQAAANAMGRQNALFNQGLELQKAQQLSIINNANKKSSPISITSTTDYSDRVAREYASKEAREQAKRQLIAADRASYNQQQLNTQANLQAKSLQRAQLAANERLANINREAQLAAARLNAQGQVLGSLFNSINSGGSNYRYW